MKDVVAVMGDGNHKFIPRLKDNQELPPIQECGVDEDCLILQDDCGARV